MASRRFVTYVACGASQADYNPPFAVMGYAPLRLLSHVGDAPSPPALTETYKHLHRTPELSRHEEQTSAFVAGELRKLGYTVTEHVGKYEDGTQGFGVVAVLENGPGPRVMIRTDMDALPVAEKTGLDYVSCSPYRVPIARLAAAQAALGKAAGSLA